jgi:hypothetical protein
MSVRDDVREFNDRDFPKYGEPKVSDSGLIGRAPFSGVFSGVVGKLRTRGESESLSNDE